MYYKLLTALLGMLLCASIANAAPFAYITNLSDYTVSVIDTKDNKQIAKIPVGDNQQPFGVAISRPDGRRVYVTNQGVGEAIGKSSITVIDALTIPPNVINTIKDLQSTPSGLAIYSAGSPTRLYIANGGANTVSVIDVSSLPPNTTVSPTTIASIPVGTGPTGVAIYGNYVFVTNSGSNSVSVIDASTNRELKKITVGSGPKGIAIGTMNGNAKAFTSCFDSNNVSIIDISSLSFERNVTVGTNPYAVAFDPTGNKAYVTNSGYPESVSVITYNQNTGNYDVAPLTTSPYSLQGLMPQNIAVTPDGLRLYTVNNEGNGGKGSISSILLQDGYMAELSDSGTFFNSPQSFGNFIGPQLYSIKATAGTNGTISPAGVKLFSQGDSQVYTITPAANYRINNISLNGNIINLSSDTNFSKTNNTYTFTNISNDTTIDVTFIKDYDYVSVSRTNIGTGSGKVTSSPAGIDCSATSSPALCSAAFQEGVTVTLTAKADPGKFFKRWIGDRNGENILINNGGYCDGLTTETCSFPMTTYAHFTAEFTDQGIGGIRMLMLDNSQSFFASLQTAFNSSVSNTKEIDLPVAGVTEAVTLNTPGAMFTLSGGWDSAFSTRNTSTPSSITGSVSIINGTLTVDNIAIK